MRTLFSVLTCKDFRSCLHYEKNAKQTENE